MIMLRIIDYSVSDGQADPDRAAENSISTDEHLAYVDSSNNTYYYVTNYQNTVEKIVDANGKIVEEYTYTLYGEVTITDVRDPANPVVVSKSVVGNPYGFQGRRLDHESNLYYYRNRYYLPDIQQFISFDPTGYVDSMNLYETFNCDPVNNVDRMGLKLTGFAGWLDRNLNPIAAMDYYIGDTDSGSVLVSNFDTNVRNASSRIAGGTIPSQISQTQRQKKLSATYAKESKPHFNKAQSGLNEMGTALSQAKLSISSGNPLAAIHAAGHYTSAIGKIANSINDAWEIEKFEGLEKDWVNEGYKSVGRKIDEASGGTGAIGERIGNAAHSLGDTYLAIKGLLNSVFPKKSSYTVTKHNEIGDVSVRAEDAYKAFENIPVNIPDPVATNRLAFAAQYLYDTASGVYDVYSNVKDSVKKISDISKCNN